MNSPSTVMKMSSARPPIADGQETNEQQIAHEDTPLLQHNDDHAAASASRNETAKKLSSASTLTTLSLTLLLLVDLGAALMIVPTNLILETSICKRLHGGDAGGFPLLCKETDVQGRLAEVRGWSSSLAVLPSMICSVPYGLAADRVGRKPIIVLATVGIVIAMAYQNISVYLSSIGFSEWAIAFTGLFLFLGGGPGVLMALLMTSITDTVSAEKRTVVFMRITAVTLFSQLVGGPLSGALVSLNKWLPIYIGLGLVSLSIPVAFKIPETAKIHRGSSVYSNARPEQTSCEEEDSNERGSFPSSGIVLAARQKLLKISAFFISHHKTVVLLIGCTLCRYVDYARTDLLLQFVTKKLSWSWAKASYVASIGFLTNLVTLLLILPCVSEHLQKHHSISSPRSNLLVCRALALALTLGNLIFGLAPESWMLILGLVPYAASQALSPLLRSIVNGMLDDSGAVAVLNTSIATVEQLALLVGAPFASWMLKIGFETGGLWIGLPYVVNAGLGLVLVLILMLFRLGNA